jgi:hypothetical protein
MPWSTGDKAGCFVGCVAVTILPYVFAVVAGSYTHCSFEMPCNSSASLIGLLLGVGVSIGLAVAVRFVIERI